MHLSPPTINLEFCTHCEVNGHHKADLTTSSNVVNKTEGGDCPAGKYKRYRINTSMQDDS